jgi:hypothetical protein
MGREAVLHVAQEIDTRPIFGFPVSVFQKALPKRPFQKLQSDVSDLLFSSLNKNSYLPPGPHLFHCLKTKILHLCVYTPTPHFLIPTHTHTQVQPPGALV